MLIASVTGDAGAGKSTLLQAFVGSLSANTAYAGYGRALAQYSTEAAYQPVREVLKQLATRGGKCGRGNLRQAFMEAAPAWLQAVPAIGDALSAALTTHRLARHDLALDDLALQLEGFVRRIAEDGPVVMALDDLHWADESTLDLVYRLSQRIDKLPLLLLLGYRPNQGRATADGELTTLLHRLRRYVSLESIELSSLDARDVAKIAHGRSVPLTPARCEELAEHTNGNPLFILELLELFAERSEDSGLPPRIESVVLERLNLIGESEREVLEVASVLAPMVNRGSIASLADLSERDLRRSLRRLTDAGLLAPDAEGERYRFSHVMISDVAASRLQDRDPYWYKHLHQQAYAQCGDDDFDDHLRRAHHAREAGRTDAATITLEAARRADRFGALAEARSLAQVAEHLASGDPVTRCAARALIGSASSRMADHRIAESSFASALEDAALLDPADRPDEVELMMWTLHRGQALRMLNRFDEARIIADELGTTQIKSVASRAQMLRAETELCGDADAAAAVRTLTLAQRGDPEPVVKYRIQGHLGLALLVIGRPNDAARHLDEALRTAETTADPFDRYEVLHWQSKRAIALLELERAVEILEELARVTKTSEVAKEMPFHLRDRSRVHGLMGAIKESANDFAEYCSWIRSPREARDRLLSTLALQCLELREIRGDEALRDFVATLTALLHTRPIDADALGILERTASMLDREGTVDAAALAGDVDPTAYNAADAIFRFDVPDLTALRGKDRRHEG